MHLPTPCRPQLGRSQGWVLLSQGTTLWCSPELLMGSGWSQAEIESLLCSFPFSTMPPLLLFSWEHNFNNSHAPKSQSQALLLENPLKTLYLLIFLPVTAVDFFKSYFSAQSQLKLLVTNMLCDSCTKTQNINLLVTHSFLYKMLLFTMTWVLLVLSAPR